VDLRSPRLVRQLPGTTTQIPTPRCGPSRCDLRSTREISFSTTGGQSDPAHITLCSVRVWHEGPAKLAPTDSQRALALLITF
jgi:hypothetical protein